MNNKTIAAIVIVALAVLGFWYFSRVQVEVPTGNETLEENEEVNGEEIQVLDEATVTYTDQGFSPSPVTVAQGGTVHFVNESSGDFWVASAMHPTHSVYPGSGIDLCASAAAGVLFDACESVAAGGTWSFTFDEKGEWAYHNHLSANHFGKVVVE
ncbi:MAG: hypothetical protein U1C52_00055 [Patescibacteria group bacterium]|nr:hypothetical protein [Patescibacteria group bacterium]